MAGLLIATPFFPAVASESPRVIPHPQIELVGNTTILLGPTAAGIKLSFKHISLDESPAGKQGLQLLTRRLNRLGAGGVVVENKERDAQIVISKLPVRDFNRALRKLGGKEALTGKRLEQAYTLTCTSTRGNRRAIQVTAVSDLGIYYALVSLCQLLEKSQSGGIVVPEAKIADWPEIGLRLAKTSASMLPLPELREFAAWMPLYKINQVGLQFHGTNSHELGPFPDNVKAICSEARQQGILETIVYFCPFRGQGYDFTSPTDQQKYAQFLQWTLDQGAHGIEVDYNDWPGKKTPIEDVINLACRTVAAKNPNAYILYCPPSRGDSMYRGPASPEMIRILSKVPTNVWPLWTGMAIKNALIEEPLKPADVEAWRQATGRRPFLWVNRVVTRDPPQNRPFARPLPEIPGAFVFRGEFLPKDLNRLFEGVHFNAGSPGYAPSESKPELVAYLATAADYVWNPQAWEAVESGRRAKRFAEIMMPIVAE